MSHAGFTLGRHPEWLLRRRVCGMPAPPQALKTLLPASLNSQHSPACGALQAALAGTGEPGALGTGCLPSSSTEFCLGMQMISCSKPVKLYRLGAQQFPAVDTHGVPAPAQLLLAGMLAHRGIGGHCCPGVLHTLLCHSDSQARWTSGRSRSPVSIPCGRLCAATAQLTVPPEAGGGGEKR